MEKQWKELYARMGNLLIYQIVNLGGLGKNKKIKFVLKKEVTYILACNCFCIDT